MKTLLPFLKKYRAQAVTAPLFKMLEALLELFVPLIIAKIIDVGIMGNNTLYVLKMCVILGGLALAGLIMSVAAQYFAARAAVGFSSELRSALFGHTLSLGYPEADALGTSALITRLTSDVDRVQSGVNLTLRLLLRSPFVVFGAVIMAFTVDKNTAVVFAITVPVLSVAVFGIMLGTMPLYKTVQKRLDSVLTAVRENLNGVRVLRAFCREPSENADFVKKTQDLYSAQRKAGKISALMSPITFVIVNVAVIALIYTGALRVNSGALTQGAVVALYNYMAQILVELIKLADLIINISKAAASAKRISSVFSVNASQTYSENGAEPDFSAPAIEFRGVSARYNGSPVNALTDISFTAKKGSSTGIIGLTGAGKTTLVNLIPRFYDKTEGELYIFGNPIESYTRSQLNKLVAVVPQKAVLFSGTIKENLLWGNKDATKEDIDTAIKVSQSENIIESKTKGLDEKLSTGAKNLSGGQRQRLTVARALVKKAPILILDDSSSALDAATDAAMRKAVSTLASPPALIVVSQRCASIKNCDNILVLDDGVLCGQGTEKELLLSCDRYKEIYASYAGGEKNG